MRGVFNAGDFAKCMHAQGVAAKTPVVKRVDNAELAHQIKTMKDVESAIDTQIVGALAPGAQIVVYAAPDDERGVLDAIRSAIFDEEHRPSVLSISFGFPENLWTPVALTILDEFFTAAALLGVTIFCASGDNGAELDEEGKPHVLAPAVESVRARVRRDDDPCGRRCRRGERVESKRRRVQRVLQHAAVAEFGSCRG